MCKFKQWMNNNQLFLRCSNQGMQKLYQRIVLICVEQNMDTRQE